MPAIVSGHYAQLLLLHLNELRLNGKYADCRILIKTLPNSSHNNSNYLLAHRLILAAGSPYFDRVFNNGDQNEQQTTVIDFSEYPPESVVVLLDYLYSGQLNLQSSDPYLLLMLATRFEIHSLQLMLANIVPAPERPPLPAHSPHNSDNNGSHANNLKRPASIDRTSQSPSRQRKRTKCAHNLLRNCANCLTPANNHAHHRPNSVSSVEYQKDHVQQQPINAILPWMDTAMTASTALPSPVFQANNLMMQPSPISSGIHSGGPNVTYNSPSTPKSRTKSQGVHTSPSLSPSKRVADQCLDPDQDDAGWCRNKKYIRRVEGGFMCTVCSKVYGRYNSVSYHVTIYHRNPPIECSQPGCSFSTREARYIHFHKYYRHGIPLPASIDLGSRSCPYCKHVAKSPGMLEKHVRRHDLTQRQTPTVKESTPRPSVICDMQQPASAMLSPYSLKLPTVPAVDNSLECELCSYRTQSMEALTQHKLFKHSPETFKHRFACQSCDFQTSTPRALHTHCASIHSVPPLSGVPIEDQEPTLTQTDKSDLDESNGSQVVQIGDEGNMVRESQERDSDDVVVDSPSAPPPSYCSDPAELSSPGETDKSDSKSTSLDDDHSQLAATQSTGYHSMINYGIV